MLRLYTTYVTHYINYLHNFCTLQSSLRIAPSKRPTFAPFSQKAAPKYCFFARKSHFFAQFSPKIAQFFSRFLCAFFYILIGFGAKMATKLGFRLIVKISNILFSAVYNKAFQRFKRFNDFFALHLKKGFQEYI